jgi:hypothetical protein
LGLRRSLQALAETRAPLAPVPLLLDLRIGHIGADQNGFLATKILPPQNPTVYVPASRRNLKSRLFEALKVGKSLSNRVRKPSAADRHWLPWRRQVQDGRWKPS